jgi:hypothetical protein
MGSRGIWKFHRGGSSILVVFVEYTPRSPAVTASVQIEGGPSSFRVCVIPPNPDP